MQGLPICRKTVRACRCITAIPLLENAHHHEVSLSQRFGDANSVQVAYYRDRVKDPELLGVGEIGSDAGYFLPDIYSGTFSFTGSALQTQGVRFVYERKLGDSLEATFDYAYGGVLELDQPGIDWALVHDNLKQAWRHSAALKLNGKLGTRTPPGWRPTLDQRSGSHAGRHVQRLGRTDGAIPEPVCCASRFLIRTSSLSGTWKRSSTCATCWRKATFP